MTMMRRLTIIAAAVLIPFATMSPARAEEDGPKIDHAWARATPGAARTAAAYFRIESPTDDRLIGLASPVAGKAELHTHLDENGVMQMRVVEGGLAVPAGRKIELKPGGLLHVMLMDLKQPLKAGDSFPLTLTFEKAGARDTTVKVERLGAMGLMDDADIGRRSFTLIDQDGGTATDAQFLGKWLLVYFGYTHCPDACPLTLSNMAEALDRLHASKREQVQPIFVTIDPERDTPAVMKDYVSAFEGVDIVGLTGTQEQVSAAEAAYQVYAERHEQDGGDYTMDHSSVIYIMGPDGRFVAIVSGLVQPERIAERLAQLVH
jgi:protein SCO1/2